MDFINEINAFCNLFPIWSFSNTGGNSYLLASNFVSQDKMSNFNPENSVFYNPVALFPFYDNEIVSVLYNSYFLYINTINASYTCSGLYGTISRENL